MVVTKEEIGSFIESKIGINMTDDTLIFEDLGIDGLDAETLMVEFSKHFNVDMSSFDPRVYYFSEYELGNIFLSFYRAVFVRKRLKKKFFNLAHLYEVVKKGKWFDPQYEIARTHP